MHVRESRYLLGHTPAITIQTTTNAVSYSNANNGLWTTNNVLTTTQTTYAVGYNVHAHLYNLISIQPSFNTRSGQVGSL